MNAILSCIVAVIAFVLPARAGTLLVPLDCPIPSAPFSQFMQDVQFPAHDPSTGTLTKLVLMLHVEHKGSVYIENRAPSPGLASITTIASLAITSPSGVPMIAHGPLGATYRPLRLAAYDGTTDFDGPSGRTIPFRIDLDVNAPFIFTDPAVLAEFNGVGTVTIHVLRSGAQNYEINTGKAIHGQSHFEGARVFGYKLVSTP